MGSSNISIVGQSNTGKRCERDSGTNQRVGSVPCFDGSIRTIQLMGIHRSLAALNQPASLTHSLALFFKPSMLCPLFSILLITASSMIVNDYYDARNGVDALKAKATIRSRLVLRTSAGSVLTTPPAPAPTHSSSSTIPPTRTTTSFGHKGIHPYSDLHEQLLESNLIRIVEPYSIMRKINEDVNHGYTQ